MENLLKKMDDDWGYPYLRKPPYILDEEIYGTMGNEQTLGSIIDLWQIVGFCWCVNLQAVGLCLYLWFDVVRVINRSVEFEVSLHFSYPLGFQGILEKQIWWRIETLKPTFAQLKSIFVTVKNHGFSRWTSARSICLHRMFAAVQTFFSIENPW